MKSSQHGHVTVILSQNTVWFRSLQLFFYVLTPLILTATLYVGTIIINYLKWIKKLRPGEDKKLTQAKLDNQR